MPDVLTTGLTAVQRTRQNAKLDSLPQQLETLGFISPSVVARVDEALDHLARQDQLLAVAAFTPSMSDSPLVAAGIVLEIAEKYDRLRVGACPERCSELVTIIDAPNVSRDYGELVTAILETPIPAYSGDGVSLNIYRQMLEYLRRGGGLNSTMKTTAVVAKLNSLLLPAEDAARDYADFRIMLQPAEYTWAEHREATEGVSLLGMPQAGLDNRYIRLVGVVRSQCDAAHPNYTIDAAQMRPRREYGQLSTGEGPGNFVGTLFGSPFDMQSEEAFLDHLRAIEARQSSASDALVRDYLGAQAKFLGLLVDVASQDLHDYRLLDLVRVSDQISALRAEGGFTGRSSIFDGMRVVELVRDGALQSRIATGDNWLGIEPQVVRFGEAREVMATRPDLVIVPQGLRGDLYEGLFPHGNNAGAFFYMEDGDVGALAELKVAIELAKHRQMWEQPGWIARPF